MNKGWIVWVLIVVVVAAVAYIYTGFRINPLQKTTTSTIATTSTVAATSAPTTIGSYLLDCSNVFVNAPTPYSSPNATCQWGGGKIGIWVQAGRAYNTTVSIVGADGHTYVNAPFSYGNVTFFSNRTLPAQNYTVTLNTGPESGPGDIPFVKLNLTTSPPAIVYRDIYNGNFSDGQYTGWNVSGPGFGSVPLNITYANSNTISCYFGQPWSNYPVTFFATTYTCGTSVSPGNLTSEAFRVNPKTPFLNFKMVSPDDSGIYVEVFQVGGNAMVKGHFNTYNISLSPNVSSTFANVSMPLTTLANKVVRIRVVAATVHPQRYMAIGEFVMGSMPNTQPGIGSQINITR